MFPSWLARGALAFVLLTADTFVAVNGYEGSTTRTVAISCTDCGRRPFRSSNEDGDFILHFTIAEDLRRLQLGHRTIYPLAQSEEAPFYVPQLVSSSSRLMSDTTDSKPFRASISRFWTAASNDAEDAETVTLNYHIDSTDIQCLASEDITITLTRTHVGTLRIADIAFITDEQNDTAESVWIDEFDSYHAISHRSLPTRRRASCSKRSTLEPMAWFPPMQSYHISVGQNLFRTLLESAAALITSIATGVVVGVVVLAFAMAVDQILRSLSRRWRGLRGYQPVALDLDLDLEAAKPRSLSICAGGVTLPPPNYEEMCRRASASR
nr:hypothetical protein CFP56_43744 [Quercus suber]